MTRLVWTTDPHLNHVPVHAWDRWVDAIGEQSPDAVIITGDISEGDDVTFQLRRIAEAVGVDIYFVLGNHDFYQSSIGQTRRSVIEASRDNPLLHYLTDLAPIRLKEGCFVIGEDGWGDATRGDYDRSPIRLNDFVLIDDFRLAQPRTWRALLQKQGAMSAERLADKFRDLPNDARDVLVVTHVPPYCESCWYMGHTTDENWAPFFVCGSVGDVLREEAMKRPDARITVLCGHTHHDGVAQMSDNLIVYTGAADYGRPDVEGVVLIDSQSIQVDRDV